MNISSKYPDFWELLEEISPSHFSVCELKQCFKPKYFSRGEIILREDERFNVLFWLKKGTMRLFYNDLDGNEWNKHFYLENDVALPIAPYARTGPINFNLAAIEDCEVMTAPASLIEEHLNNCNKKLEFYMPFVEWLLEQKIHREYDMLTKSAAARICSFARKHPALWERIPDYHLASFLGVTAVSFSRLKVSLLNK